MLKEKNTETKERQLTMRFSGRLVKHLGLQMYSGAVPAIAELIANAWDAMAKNVYINVPLGKSLEHTDKISVRDDGSGISFEECNNHYLVVGRDRRSEEGDYSTEFGEVKPRKLMARKGIGKLSGLPIPFRAINFLGLTSQKN